MYSVTVLFVDAFIVGSSSYSMLIIVVQFSLFGKVMVTWVATFAVWRRGCDAVFRFLQGWREIALAD
jgi:hypothetical protein